MGDLMRISCISLFNSRFCRQTEQRKWITCSSHFTHTMHGQVIATYG